MAGVAGAVDFVSINTKGAKLQNMLDATALAIGTKYYSGMTKGEVEAFGREFFLTNMYGGPKNDVEFDFSDDVQEFSADETSDGSSKLISVASTIDHEGSFIGFSSNWQTKRRSYVRLAPGQPACVLALDPHASSTGHAPCCPTAQIRIWSSPRACPSGWLTVGNRICGGKPTLPS
jgi:hypothetical protein